jgi:hypothetical protein
MDEVPQQPQRPTTSAKRRWLGIGGFAALLLVGVGLWWGLSFQAQRAAIQRTMTTWQAIDKEFWPQVLAGSRPQSPEAAARQEALLSRYFGQARQIDLSGCPPEFRAAFADYLAAKEQHDRSLHGPAAPGKELQNVLAAPSAARKMYEAYDRLEAIAKKYRVQCGGPAGPSSHRLEKEAVGGQLLGCCTPGSSRVA